MDSKKKKEAQQKSSASKPKKTEVTLPRTIDYSAQFRKDFAKIKHSGVHDLSRLKDVLRLLVNNDAPLPAEWGDHNLKGEFSEFRELHVKGDLLLMYQISTKIKDYEQLVAVRLGTHSEIFG